MKPTPKEFSDGLKASTSLAEKYLKDNWSTKMGTPEFLCAVTVLTQLLVAKDHPRVFAAMLAGPILWRRVQLGTNVDIVWHDVRNNRRVNGWGSAMLAGGKTASAAFADFQAVFEWRRVINQFETVLRHGDSWAKDTQLVGPGGQPATALNNTLGGAKLLQFQRCGWLSLFAKMLGAGNFAKNAAAHKALAKDFLVLKKAVSTAEISDDLSKYAKQKETANEAIPELANENSYPLSKPSGPGAASFHSRFWQHYRCAGLFGLMWPPPGNKYSKWQDLVAARVQQQDEPNTLEADALAIKTASGAKLKALQAEVLSAQSNRAQRSNILWQMTRTIQANGNDISSLEGFVLELSPPTLELASKADEAFNRKTWQATKNMGPWLRFFGRTVALWYRFLANTTNVNGTPMLSGMHRALFRPTLVLRFGSEINLGFRTLGSKEGQPYGVDLTLDPNGQVSSPTAPTAAGYADAAKFVYASILAGADEVLDAKSGTDPGWPHKASNVIKLAVVVNGTSRLLKVNSSGKPIYATNNGKQVWAEEWCVAGEHGEMPLLVPAALAKLSTYVGADIYGRANHNKAASGEYQEVVGPSLRSPFDSARVFDHLEKVAPGKHWLVAETGFGALSKDEWLALKKVCDQKLWGTWKPVGGTPCTGKPADPPTLWNYVRASWLRAFYMALRAKYMDLFPKSMEKLVTVNKTAKDGMPVDFTFDLAKVRQLVFLPFNINVMKEEGQDFSLVDSWQPAANTTKAVKAVTVAKAPGQKLAAAQEALQSIYESSDWTKVLDWPAIPYAKKTLDNNKTWTDAAKAVAVGLFAPGKQ